jgi:hypothetical protein
MHFASVHEEEKWAVQVVSWLAYKLIYKRLLVHSQLLPIKNKNNVTAMKNIVMKRGCLIYLMDTIKSIYTQSESCIQTEVVDKSENTV